MEKSPGNGLLVVGQIRPTGNGDHTGWTTDQLQVVEKSKRTIWYRKLKLLLLIVNCDTNAIFRTPKNGHQAGNRLSRVKPDDQPDPMMIRRHRFTRAHLDLNLRDDSNPLEWRPTEQDRRRNTLAPFIQTFVIYFFIKCYTISCAQHSLLRYMYLVPRGYRPPLLSLDLVKLICNYLGNPLHLLKDMALLIYMAWSGISMLAYVLVPLYLRLRPFNMAPIRFFLDPTRELKRIDSNIEAKLDHIRTSLEVYLLRRRQLLQDSAREFDRLCTLKSRQHQFHSAKSIDREQAKCLLQSELTYCATIRSYLDQYAGRIPALRPEPFKPIHFGKSLGQACGAFELTREAYTILGYIITFLFMTLKPYLDRCRTAATICSPFYIYTLPEMLFIFEMALIFVLNCSFSSLNFHLFTIMYSTQMNLIDSMHGQLVKCNQFINLHDNQLACNDDDLNRNLHLKIPARGESIRERRRRQLNRKQRHKMFALETGQITQARLSLDKFLLEKLIKLMICENELRDNSRSISLLSIPNFFYPAIVTTCGLANWQFKFGDNLSLRYFCVIASFATGNTIAIMCARAFAHIIKFERTMWLLLAKNSAAFLKGERWSGETHGTASASPSLAHNNATGFESPDAQSCTFVSDLWRKFVYNTSLDLERYSVNMLGIKLTYERIIEINFFAVFLYSLSQGPK